MNANTANTNPDTDYPLVREKFNQALFSCVRKLTKADMRFAQEALELDLLIDVDQAMLCDTALFSPHINGKRAIDRIVAKLTTKSPDKIESIIKKMPSAFFTILEVVSINGNQEIIVKDIIDDFRQLTIMDRFLPATAKPGMLLAGRIIDIGPWHIGFGIMIPLAKSEVVAINLALSTEDSLKKKRNDLHELIYVCRIHESNLVIAAVTPIILALSLSVDASDSTLPALIKAFRLPKMFR